MRSTLRYPSRALTGDFVRAGLGFAGTFGVALATPWGGIGQAIFGALALLFAAFGWQTWRRSAARVEVSDAGVTIDGVGRTTLAWDEISAMKLKYYSLQRDRKTGWMQMTLAGPGGSIRLDSALEDFDLVAREAARRLSGQVELDRTTRGNLESLGVFLDEPAEGAAKAAQ